MYRNLNVKQQTYLCARTIFNPFYKMLQKNYFIHCFSNLFETNRIRKSICFVVALATVMAANAQKFVFKGSVKTADGKAIQGVVVNNGTDFTTTNAKGQWTLCTDTCVSKFVQISTPADYVLPKSKSIAKGFYVSVGQLVKDKCRHNFVLQPRDTKDNTFYYIAISDPQVKNDKHMELWRSQTVEDLKATTDALSKEHEVVTMTLGDIVWDNMQLFDDYAESIQQLPITAFQCIGNHDFDRRYQALNNMPYGSGVYGEQAYCTHFGPTDYSFNIAGVHVVTLKNINYMGKKGYREQFTEAQLAWLRRDLSYVPKGSMVIINMHAALWNPVEKEGNVLNANDLKSVLRGYRVHIFNGHTHFFHNNTVGNDIYEHNIGAACGAWWRGDVNRCGAPNGYLVVKASADSLTSQYKPTGGDYAQQMRVYSKGEFLSQPYSVVANVWDCDSLTTVEWYEDGQYRGKMTQFTDSDERYLQSRGSHVKECVTTHLFKATPAWGSHEVKVVVKNRFGQVHTETVDVNRAWLKALSSDKRPKVIAHRGYWRYEGAVQNSLSSLRASAQAGVYGSEFDVQITADGEVIVNHDPHLGGLPIAKSTYAQLVKARLGNGEPIPTLAKYLDEAKKHKDLKIILEIKKQANDSVEAVLVRKTLEAVKASGLSSRVQYISFSQFVCDQIIRNDKTADVAYLGGNMSPKEVKEHGFSGIDYSMDVLRVHPEWIDKAHKLGLTVNVWTIATEEHLKFVTTLHPDFITTDIPEDALRMLSKGNNK